MKNLDYIAKIRCYTMLETLLENLNGSGDLIRELEQLKEQYSKNVIN